MQRNRTFDGCDPKVPPLLRQRRPHPLRDQGRIVVDRKRRRAFKSMRSSYEDAKVSGNPRFVRPHGGPAASDHGRLNALTAGARHALDVEYRERHTEDFSGEWRGEGPNGGGRSSFSALPRCSPPPPSAPPRPSKPGSNSRAGPPRARRRAERGPPSARLQRNERTEIGRAPCRER